LTLDGADWECQESVVLGGYSATCVSCVEAMCTSQLVVCETSSCMTCEEPVFTCEGQMCSSACGGTSSSSGGTTGEGGAAAGGSCAGLMMCCGLVAAVDPTYGTTCATIAAGGNEASCQTVIAMFPPGITSYCN
jgi:hypothetical protein